MPSARGRGISRRDHGAHPSFKSEWWYFTGNLKENATGRPFGYQLTIFRQGVQVNPAQKNSKWAVRDFYFGHFTISDMVGNFHVVEEVSRGALDEAKVSSDRMGVILKKMAIAQSGAEERYHLAAVYPEMGIDFELRPLKPLVLEGVNGLSQKSSGAGNASYYYSYPRLETKGR